MLFKFLSFVLLQCYQEWMIFFIFLLNCEGFTQSTFLDDFLGQYTWTFNYAPKLSPFISLFCFQPIFWQMAFLIGWCKENGNFIRKKTSTGSKIWTYSFFWSKYPTKIESQCQRCYCLGQHTNKLYNFGHKSTNITCFLVFLGQFCPNCDIHCFYGPNDGTIVIGSQF